MDATDGGRTRGEVIVFTGPGKGKTTAALGVGLRMIARGGKVVFIYFTGPQHPVLGEVKSAASFGSNWRTIGIKSEAKDVSYLDDFTESVDTVTEALAMAHNLWLHECDLLVLDDIIHHLDQKSIDIAQVLALINDRPPNASIVLTGRSAPEPILQRAGLVTEFLKIKQPPNADMHLRRVVE
jgi:cob(I)alamin adenosyltransferase